jgi:hypothetical protein
VASPDLLHARIAAHEISEYGNCEREEASWRSGGREKAKGKRQKGEGSGIGIRNTNLKPET